MLGGVSDALNLMTKMGPRRIANAAKIYSSFQYSRITKVPQMWGMPIAVSIEPTTSCNLRCPECPSGLRSFTRPTGMLQVSMFKEVIDQLSHDLSFLTFYFQGEPYLNPAFLQMVEYASNKGIYTSTSTNAHYLSSRNAEATVKSGLDRLIISIDGTSQDTYEQYRVGGSLEKVIDGTKHVLEWRRRLKAHTPHVIFQFLVVKPNEHEIKAVYDLADKLGVDKVALKTAQIYDYKNGSSLIPENDRYARYARNADGTYSIKNELLDHCWKMWHSCVITWDGKVVPCCFDKDATYVLGDLTKDSFYSIWNGEAYREFRSTLMRARSEIEICRNCTEGTKVWA